MESESSKRNRLAYYIARITPERLIIKHGVRYVGLGIILILLSFGCSWLLSIPVSSVNLFGLIAFSGAGFVAFGFGFVCAAQLLNSH